MLKILLVEDDEVIAERVKTGLEKSGYRVETETNGTAGLERAIDYYYSLVILDLMLPGMGGMEICATLRKKRSTVPILMLTARDALADRVQGLDAGADDYLSKPFEYEELEARVRSLVRRDKLHRSRVIRIEDLEIDTGSREVRRGGTPIKLTRHEYDLLHALAANEGRVLTREVILERVWGNDDIYTSTVNVHIASLRKKLDADHPVKLIHTLYGLGYVLRRSSELAPA